MRVSHQLWAAWLIVIFGLALVACGGRPSVSPTSDATGQTPQAASPTPGETPLPTSSPTPQAPAIILWAPDAADTVLVARLQAFLDEQAAQAGMRFQLLPQLPISDLTGNEIIVAVPPASGLNELAATYPQARFLAVGMPDAQPAANLSVIAPPDMRPDQIGFAAGYLAASITPDWRTGVITASGSPTGEALRQGFVNGQAYFCGLCLPVYPPFPGSGYPISVEALPDSGPAGWQAALTMLSSWQVGVVLLDPALVDEQLLQELSRAGVHLILTDLPPSEFRATWVASLGYGDILRGVQQVWAGLLKGEAGVRISQPLELIDTNPELLSPGRKRLAEAMLQDLLAGLINTGVDPSVWQQP